MGDAIESKNARIGRSRRLAEVDLDKIQQQFTTVLKREAAYLLDESFKEKLSVASGKSLVTYLKLLKELREMELRELEMMSDEELETQVSKSTKK